MGSLSDLHYPPARRDYSIVDDYHGVLVSDPYRWLENPYSEETKAFVEAQVAFTDSILAECGERARLREQITKFFDYPRYEIPFKLGGKYFYFHNSGLQAQSVLYVQSDLDSEAEVLLDPNALSDDGTVAVNTFSISGDGKYLAYGLSLSGSDWVTIKVMRIADRMTEPDTISWYITLAISKDYDTVNKLYYCDLSALSGGLDVLKARKDMLPFVKLVDNFEARYDVVTNNDTEFTFLTNKESPRYKLVRVDLNKPEIWSDVLPEDQRLVLKSAYAVNGNQLLVCYFRDVKYILQIRDLKTGQLLQNLPIDIGTVTGISGKRNDAEIFIGFTSFLTPGIIYQCNLSAEAPTMEVFREASVPGFNRDDFHAKQVFVSSKDGTKIPMFIVSRKDIILDGSRPTLLHGYGGFNLSPTPTFFVWLIVLVRNFGFIFCMANIRGGGEYGEEWHKSGSLSKKQNCFDDFIAAAEFLISTGYTHSGRLCIEGGSNGGLLIAACINQRPDLFGCAIVHAGFMDMLRFHKFTIGHAGTSDYGCSDKKDEFQWLFKYSPLHNVIRPWEKSSDSSSQYPPTMLLTADHDDRVVPLHELKVLATMQYILCTSLENTPQKNPIIARIDRKDGHGLGRSTQKMINEAADRYGFAVKMMGVSWND